MGLFNRNFNKPGPGVSKDEPRKKGFARFIELLFRDLGDLVKLNLLLCICILPSVLVFLAGMFGFYTIYAFGLSLLLAFPIGGAMVATFYYITKMMRDDPSYVWYEFKRKFNENFKQAAPVGMLCTAFIYAQILLWGSLVFSDTAGDILWFIIALVSLIVFGMIAPYVFLHFAYIDLKTFSTIKNSVLMSFAYLPRSFMGAILGGILWIVFALYLPISLMVLPIMLLIGATMSILMCLSWVWKPFNEYFKVEETLIEKKEEKED